MNRERRLILVQAVLFITTFITTTLAGAEWTHGRSVFMEDFGWADFVGGLEYSVPFLLILTVHEFGHYFMSLYHKVKATLPFFLPMPPLPFSLGTLGAVIAQDRAYSSKQTFDIGLAGPLAGFVVAVGVLLYGFMNLPPAEHIFTIHPEYKQYGLNYAEKAYTNMKSGTVDIIVGKNLLFLFFEKYIADPARIPDPHELYHYPWLFSGFLALMFTSINLLPIGQLDGGHITYGLFGFKIHRVIATISFFALLIYASLGYISPLDPKDELIIAVPMAIVFLYFALSRLGVSKQDTLMFAVMIFAVLFVVAWLVPDLKGYPMWLVFVFVLGRFVGIKHPPSEIEQPLDAKRVILGWISLGIFILCFCPAPIAIRIIE